MNVFSFYIKNVESTVEEDTSRELEGEKETTGCIKYLIYCGIKSAPK